jgi:hypothetical protein
VEGLAWQIQFWLCGYAAATMLWINHRHCLEAIGGTSAEYYGEVRFEIARFLRDWHEIESQFETDQWSSFGRRK